MYFSNFEDKHRHFKPNVFRIHGSHSDIIPLCISQKASRLYQMWPDWNQTVTRQWTDAIAIFGMIRYCRNDFLPLSTVPHCTRLCLNAIVYVRQLSGLWRGYLCRISYWYWDCSGTVSAKIVNKKRRSRNCLPIWSTWDSVATPQHTDNL